MSEATDQSCSSKANDIEIQMIKIQIQVIQMIEKIISLVPANYFKTSDVI